MASTEQIKSDVSHEVEGADFVQRLAERVGLTARASAVFGDAVEHEGVTVIPVAKATWGFGGGSGGDGATQGSGGGGGGFVAPLGFIEVRRGEAKFVRIHDLRLAAVGLGMAAGIVGFMIGRRH
jgi:uncharacterized spore protein YtfJ